MSDTFLTASFALVGSALTAYLVTPAVAALARRVGAIDIPGGRKVHVAAVPRLGGAALFAGFLVGTFAYGLAFGWERLGRVFTGESFLLLLVPAGFVFLVGVVDDVRGLGPAPRVVAELLAAGVLLQSGYIIDVVANPFGEPLHLGLMAVPVTLLWFVGVTNSFNLVDGIDGLLGVLGVAALGGAAGVAFLQGQTGTGVLSLALCGALLGFLRWNWHPARIFLGDSGSLLVGFVVAAISLKVARTTDMKVLNFHVPLALCAVPVTETFLTIARRYVNGQAYFSGDQSHIHHVLLKSGLPVPVAVGILGLLAALFSAAAVLSLSWRRTGALTTIAVLLVAVVIGLRRLHYVEFRVLLDRILHNLFRPRRRGLSELTVLARAGDRLRESVGPGDVEECLRALCADARLTFVALELTGEAARAVGPPPPPPGGGGGPGARGGPPPRPPPPPGGGGPAPPPPDPPRRGAGCRGGGLPRRPPGRPVMGVRSDPGGRAAGGAARGLHPRGPPAPLRRPIRARRLEAVRGPGPSRPRHPRGRQVPRRTPGGGPCSPRRSGGGGVR